MDPSLTEETHEGQRNSVGNRPSRRHCRRRGRRLQHRPGRRGGGSPTYSGTMDRETLSATIRKQVVERRCRRRGRRLQHRSEPPADYGPTRTDTKDSESVSGTGLRLGNVENEVDVCSTCENAELTDPDKERHDGPRTVVGNRSE